MIKSIQLFYTKTIEVGGIGKDQEISNKRFFFYRKLDFAMNVVTFFYLIALFYSLIYWFTFFVWLVRAALLLALVMGIIETIQGNRFARQYRERDTYYHQLNQHDSPLTVNTPQRTSPYSSSVKRKQGAV